MFGFHVTWCHINIIATQARLINVSMDTSCIALNFVTLLEPHGGDFSLPPSEIIWVTIFSEFVL